MSRRREIEEIEEIEELYMIHSDDYASLWSKNADNHKAQGTTSGYPVS